MTLIMPDTVLGAGITVKKHSCPQKILKFIFGWGIGQELDGNR